ncbi:hypothetical protein B0H13DRAFT_2534893 [Mycena leptocephala]|nr:hypothetical protein B0H13DRAFT_2534893 [Mycena leptocephala]
MKGISSQAFQFVATEANPSLAHHVRRKLQSLRSIGAGIRDPAVPGSFSIESLDSTAPHWCRGFPEHAGNIPEHNATIFGAVFTLSQVTYSRIVPHEVSVMLKRATEDEADLSRIGGLVVKHCGMLAALRTPLRRSTPARSTRPRSSAETAEQMVSIIDSAANEFITLFRRNGNEHPAYRAARSSGYPSSRTSRILSRVSSTRRALGSASNTGTDDTPVPLPSPAPNTGTIVTPAVPQYPAPL